MTKKTTKNDENFDGIGNKRPLVDIPIDKIDLDDLNPRISESYKGETQSNLLELLYNEFDLEELAYSMAANGYFDEEPIVVVPKNKKLINPNESVQEQQKKIEEALNKEERFVVVEGNRRVATAKLITDAKLRKELDIRDSLFHVVNEKILQDISILPAIVYPKRSDVSPYLGVRHITGIKKWGTFAKARYLAQRINEEKEKKSNYSFAQAVNQVQKKVGDRTDVIRKLYLAYSIVQQAEEDLDFDTNQIKDRFSLLQLALTSAPIAAYVGLKGYKDIEEDIRVPLDRLEKLERVLTWIFGNKNQGKSPLFTDSRLITSRLAPVLANENSRDSLERGGSLEDAYEMSGGYRGFILSKLRSAKNDMQATLQYLYKLENDIEIQESVREIIILVNKIKSDLKI